MAFVSKASDGLCSVTVSQLAMNDGPDCSGDFLMGGPFMHMGLSYLWGIYIPTFTRLTEKNHDQTWDFRVSGGSKTLRGFA